MLLSAFDRPGAAQEVALAEDGPPADKAAESGRGFDPISGQWVTSESAKADRVVTLRPWETADLDAYMAQLDDPEMWRYLPETYPDPLTREDAQMLIDLSSHLAHHHVCAVCTHDGPVGQVRVAFSEDRPREAEISYWIGRAHWGQGLAVAALAQFIKAVFTARPEVHQLMARVHPDNVASQKVVTRAGFVYQEKRQDADGWLIFARRR